MIGLGPRGRGNVVGKALAYAEYELAAVSQDVPDFRPGPDRAAGELPAGVRL